MRQKQGPKRHKADSAEILIFRYFFLLTDRTNSVDLDSKGNSPTSLQNYYSVDFNKIILQHNRSIKLIMQRIIRNKNGAGICQRTTHNLGLDTGTTL